MIENNRTYQYQVIEEKNLHFDFSALYDYIANENNTSDPYFIGDDFGDNVYYYIEHIFGIKIQSYENEEVNHYNNELVNDIANDFYNWIEQNRVFEDLENGVE